MEPLRLFIEKYTPLPVGDWERIREVFTPTTLSKGEVLLAEDSVCRHLYFLESGLLRYYIYKNGNDITKFFTEAPYVFTSQASFTAEKPAKENIEALEDSVLLQTTLKQANDLLALPSWSTFVRKLVQEVQFYTEEILQEIQTETAEQRYERMLVDTPQLVQRVPLKYIASYLAIAPQSLSRIRKKLAQSART